MSDVLLSERHGNVAVIKLNRPERRNALNTALLRALESAFQAAETSDEIAVLVLTGADPAFCGGVDMKELEETGRAPDMGNPLAGLTKPLIGAINGAAVTGGLELALMCDFLLVSSRATFADTHGKIGLLPGWGQLARLPHAIGTRMAAEMILTSAPLSAERAYEVGLANEVVSHETLMSRAIEVAEAIAESDGPAVRAMLAQLREGAGHPVAKLLQTERERAAEWQGAGFDTTLVAEQRARVTGQRPL